MCGRLKNFVNLTEVKSKTEDAMNIEEFREYCLSLPGVTEKMPFTALNDAYSRDVLCFYVGSKWFCYVNIVLFDRCCVKSTPEEAAELRARYEGVRPAWHMNKLNDAYSRDVLCFYVGSKWFCYVNIVLFDRCCVKSTPEEAAELRARYEGVRPAWHMNKRMWSDVYFGSDVSDALVCRLVENSYRLVRDSLPAKERETL